MKVRKHIDEKLSAYNKIIVIADDMEKELFKARKDLKNIYKIDNFVDYQEIDRKLNEDFGIEPLTNLLDSFVNNFKSLNLEKALLPYRDYCAQYVYNKYLKNITTIAIDFDDLIFNTNNVTEDYNTITNLKLLNKIKI